jgi:hypothetical protein
MPLLKAATAAMPEKARPTAKAILVNDFMTRLLKGSDVVKITPASIFGQAYFRGFARINLHFCGVLQFPQ